MKNKYKKLTTKEVKNLLENKETLRLNRAFNNPFCMVENNLSLKEVIKEINTYTKDDFIFWYKVNTTGYQKKDLIEQGSIYYFDNLTNVLVIIDKEVTRWEMYSLRFERIEFKEKKRQTA